MILVSSEETKQRGIYQIRNLVTNQIYLGSASRTFYYRWHLHRFHLRKKDHHCKHLQNSFNKYGEENFEFEIIEVCGTEVILEREQYYLDTRKPEYNTVKFAGHTLGYKATPEEVRRNQLSNAHLAKKIVQIDIESLEIIKVWDSINQAVKFLQCDRQSINFCLNRTYQFGKGFIWRYWDERFDVQPILSHGDKVPNITQLNSTTDEIIRTWKCPSDAAKELNLHVANICAAISGRIKSCGGYKWKREISAEQMVVVKENITTFRSLLK